MKIDDFIKEFNSDGFDGSVQKFFGKPKSFLMFVAKNKRQGDIDITVLDSELFNDDEFFDWLEQNQYLENVDYNNLYDDVKNKYLAWRLAKDPDATLSFICDNLITDVEMRGNEFWLYLRDREELADFYKSYSRDYSPEDLAKSIFSDDDFYERFHDTVNDIYDDVIGELNDENIIRLGDVILKNIGNQDLNVEDYESDFFHELAEVQARDGFFQITSDDIKGLIDDEEAMKELLNGDLEDLKWELYSLHDSAYNYAYEEECYELVYDGLSEFFTSRIEEQKQETSEGGVKYKNWIRIRDFHDNVATFIDENKNTRWGGDTLEYYGNYTSMMNSLFNDDVYERISFGIPEYADWSKLKKQINELFGDYI